MTRPEILAFVRKHKLAVQASATSSGAPQAAVVGVVFTDAFECIFDTLDTSRKIANLRKNPRLAVVVGWDEEQTVQWEGTAEILGVDDDAGVKATYLAAFPDGTERLAWPGLVYVRARPTWVRYSDFRGAEPSIVELRDFA